MLTFTVDTSYIIDNHWLFMIMIPFKLLAYEALCFGCDFRYFLIRLSIYIAFIPF